MRVPRREEPECTFEPSDVPVGLGRGRDRRRLERSVQPDRVDLHKPAEPAEDRGDDGEQTDGLDRVRRPETRADDVPLLMSGPAMVRVLLPPEDREMDAEQT